MPLADESGMPQFRPPTGRRYHLNILTDTGGLTVQVLAEPEDTVRTFPSLLLAVDYIERDLAAPSSVRISSGIQ